MLFIHHSSQVSIKKKLEEFMATLGRNLTPAQREAIEMTGTMVARDNVELACAFIQKKAVEKALPEIDKRLKVCQGHVSLISVIYDYPILL